MEDGQGEAFLAIARNGRLSAQGKKTIRPLRIPIEPSTVRRSLVRHAPSRPQWTCQLYQIKGYGNGVICAPEKLHAEAARPILTES